MRTPDEVRVMLRLHQLGWGVKRSDQYVNVGEYLQRQRDVKDLIRRTLTGIQQHDEAL